MRSSIIENPFIWVVRRCSHICTRFPWHMWLRVLHGGYVPVRTTHLKLRTPGAMPKHSTYLTLSLVSTQRLILTVLKVLLLLPWLSIAVVVGAITTSLIPLIITMVGVAVRRTVVSYIRSDRQRGGVGDGSLEFNLLVQQLFMYLCEWWRNFTSVNLINNLFIIIRNFIDNELIWSSMLYAFPSNANWSNFVINPWRYSSMNLVSFFHCLIYCQSCWIWLQIGFA